MAHYKIKIYKRGQEDLKDIVQYLNTLSQTIALKHYDEIIAKIGSLSEMPHRCPHVRDTTLRLKGYRYLIVNRYIVFYTVNDNLVQVRRIIYNRRQYQSIL